MRLPLIPWYVHFTLAAGNTIFAAHGLAQGEPWMLLLNGSCALMSASQVVKLLRRVDRQA